VTETRSSPPRQRFRLASGGLIDRSRPLAFTFDGVRLSGYQGDTLASALIANGVHLVGRSFKYHRPRGFLSAESAEPNALVTVHRKTPGRATPNCRATEVELYDGLIAESQNRWPSLGLDFAAVIDRVGALFPAGFYYKTFMGPRLVGSNRVWPRIFEPAIRRMAGLGRPPAKADPDSYATIYAHCDVLVIGAGPAGLSAARAAAEAGARVILCDEQAETGGSLLSDPDARVDAATACDWLAEQRRHLAASGHVRILTRTTAFGVYPDNLFGLVERISDHLADPDPDLPRERLWQVRARAAVLAAGAIERPLVFADNDRPGVLLASAAMAFATRYAARPGSRAVIACVDDSGYRAARALRKAGVEIAAIADARPPAAIAQVDLTGLDSIRIEPEATLIGAEGRLRVSGVRLGRIEFAERIEPMDRVACDLALMAGGWTPTVHLYAQARGRLRYDAGRAAFLPEGDMPRLFAAGACRGMVAMADCVADGFEAGVLAARGGSVRRRPVPQLTSGVIPQAAVVAAGSGRAFVDFQNDVTAKDIRLAAQEGFRSIEHIKRYTTTGMATDQGKTSNVNALAMASHALGRPIPGVGHTTFRPPYTPVTFGALAGPARGAAFDPVRRTPIDGWARRHGAVFEDVGQWQRARYFPRTGETMQRAVARECRTVRARVGVFDASTLGKIEVVGPDAGRFLDRMYVTPVARLAVGRCRYAVQLNEAGFVIDDGIVARLEPDRYHVTTTTGGAARVLALMEDYLQTEFRELRCWLTSTTEQWAVIAVQGPSARDVLQPLVSDIDLSPSALPHLSVAAGRIAGVPMRLFRVSFTGELGFEVNVPSGQAETVWECVMAEAERHGGSPYGTEAMHVLRAEKGYIIVGQESDGTVTPRDLGFGDGAAKADFVGKRALARPDMTKPDRPQLVGLLPLDPSAVLEEGAQITQDVHPRPGARAIGHVTSSYWSPTLGRAIALALVAGGRGRLGERLYVPMPAGALTVEVTAPAFFDPTGERLHG